MQVNSIFGRSPLHGSAPTRPSLRELISHERVIFTPGVWDALSARLVEEAGFMAMATSGAAISASLGFPDVELMTMTENLNAVRALCAATSLPVIADVDAGYGAALNVVRTVKEFEAAGVAAIYIVDEVSPHRPPAANHPPRPLLPINEAVGKIRAAVDARSSEELLIMAISVARGEDAVTRMRAYAEAGADMLFPNSRSFQTVEEWTRCREVVGKPLVSSLMSMSWPEREFTREKLEAAGVRIAFFPLQPLYAAVAAIRSVLSELRTHEYGPAITVPLIPTSEFQRFVGHKEVDEIDQEYGTTARHT